MNYNSDQKVDTEEIQNVSDLMTSEDYDHYHTVRNEPTTLNPLPIQEEKPLNYYEGNTAMNKANADINYFKGCCFSGALEYSVLRLIRDYNQWANQF